MAEQHRAMPAEIIDIAATVDIPFARPFGAGDVKPIRLDVAPIVGDARREHLLSLLRARRRTWRRSAIGGYDWRIRSQRVGHGVAISVSSFPGLTRGSIDGRASLAMTD